MSTTETKKSTGKKPVAAAPTEQQPSLDQAALIAQVAAAVAKEIVSANALSVPPTLQVVNTRAPREDYIVFNPSPGYVHIADAKILFDPFEARDLTWEKDEYVGYSVDLEKALRLGSLIRISREQLGSLLEMKQQRERQSKAAAQLKARQKLKKVSADGAEFIAEEVSAATGNHLGQSEIDITGEHNDPLLYVNAFNSYFKYAQEQGKFADAQAFDEMIRMDLNDPKKRLRTPGEVKQMLNNWAQTNDQFPSSLSGDGRHGRAVVAQPGGAPPLAVQMTNFNRDQMIAGLSSITTDGGVLQNQYLNYSEELAPGEELDLMDDDDDNFSF
jgi:hypothetical protein